jgi:hypothetical protein
MTARKIAGFVVPSLFIALLAVGGQRPAAAISPAALDSAASCSLADVEIAKARFQDLAAYRRYNPNAVSIDMVRGASEAYIALAEQCYDQLYGHASETIDEGGLMVGAEGVSSYNLFGNKWGLGSPFAAAGVDENGPRIGGGIVTYSWMANGIAMEGAPEGLSVAITTLPSSGCFQADIVAGFNAWSAVANITFSLAADSGLAWNAAGAGADIRIGAHIFDGPSSVLAHAYFPPPNGDTAAGDMHFDLSENWTCTPGAGAIDIGIVATHEIGHAIGLNHETRSAGRPALMNPFYNPSIAPGLLGDDINGGEYIYGSSVGNSHDLMIDFGPGFGLYVLNYGVGFSPVHGLSPDQVVTGDFDGNGIDDLMVDFGAGTGVWRRMNNVAWSAVHPLSPTFMAVGDLDNNGDDDVVMNFAGAGLYRFLNNTTFSQIHPLNPTVFAIGNIDNSLGSDIVMTFAGAGTWQFRNNTTFINMHPQDATQIVIGDFDETTSSTDNADDILCTFPGFGIWVFRNVALPMPPAPDNIHPIVPLRIATGDMNGNGRDEIVADFGGGVGVYVFEGFVGWSPGPLTLALTQEMRLGDLDNNGQWDLVADFGTSGLWAYINNTSWVNLHGFNIEGMVFGDFN